MLQQVIVTTLDLQNPVDEPLKTSTMGTEVEKTGDNGEVTVAKKRIQHEINVVAICRKGMLTSSFL